MKVQIMNNNGYFGIGPFKSDKDKKRQKPHSRSVFEPAFSAVPQTPSQNTGIDGSLPVDPFEAQRQSQEKQAAKEAERLQKQQEQVRRKQEAERQKQLDQQAKAQERALKRQQEQQRLEAVVFEERQQQLAQRRADQLAKKGPDNGYLIPDTDPEDVYLRTLETPEQTRARRAAELPNRLWPDETLEEKQERARKAQDYRRGLERAAFWTDLEDRLGEHEDASAIESRRNKFLADRLWPDEGKTIDDVIAAYQEEQINKLADYEIAWEDREIEKRLTQWDQQQDALELPEQAIRHNKLASNHELLERPNEAEQQVEQTQFASAEGDMTGREAMRGCLVPSGWESLGVDPNGFQKARNPDDGFIYYCMSTKGLEGIFHRGGRKWVRGSRAGHR